MECCLCREAVVIGVNTVDRQYDLEMAPEDEILEVQCFAVFLDRLGPLWGPEMNPLC